MTASLARLAGRVPAGGRPGIGARAAQRLARAELAKPAYHRHQPWPQRLLHAVAEAVDRLFRLASAAPGGWWAVVALVIAAVAAAVAIAHWAGPVRRTRRLPPGHAAPLHAETARGHRAQAMRLAEAGDYGGALCEQVRAMAAELEERAVLPSRPGRTADEFAAEAAQVLRAHTTGLRDAAQMFDEIRYGDRVGTAAGYGRVRDLDGLIRASLVGRPAVPGPATAGSTPR